jgi:DNA polymerase-4
MAIPGGAMKILCVLLPHFPLRCEVERKPGLEGLAVVLFRTAGSRRLVLDFSPELGRLRSGLALQQAVSLYGEVEMVRADMPHYLSAFNRILDSLEKVSPLVEGTDPGCVCLGVNGLELIYRSDNALVDAARRAVPEVFKAQFGIAEGKFPASLLAASSPPGEHRTLTGAADSFLKDFSCDVLPISERSKRKLHDFGLHTLGQAAAIALGPLQSQFGPEGKRIWELARGQDDTPLYPRGSEETIEESSTLPSVTASLEAILAGIELLLARIFSRDALKDRGICSLLLWAHIWGAGYWERSIKFKEPATNIRKILSRIKLTLEASPPPGPVEELGLRLTGQGHSTGQQRSLFSEVRANDHLMEDIRQLELRLGAPQVFKVKEIEPWSRIPERRQVLTPINR